MVVKTHPNGTYEFDSETGKYRMIGKNDWLDGNRNNNGYLQCTIKKKDEKGRKTFSLHRAIWETFVGNIPENYQIDHIDNDKKNNKLSNLQCITRCENNKKRDHTFLIEIRKLAHKKINENIKSINIENNETHIFKTKSQAAKYHGCSPALVYCICTKKNLSKTFGRTIRFEYTKEEPNTFVADGRVGKTRVSEEEKKQKIKEAVKRYYEKNKDKNKEIRKEKKIK